MNVIGIDPANKCGFAHSSGPLGVWNLKLKGDKHSGRRLERFRRHLFRIRREHGIDRIGIEEASFGSINQNTAAKHNELLGVAKLVAAEWDIPIHCYKPPTIKKFLTGNGRASKQQMISAVSALFGVETTNDDIADAVAIMELAKTETSTKETIS